MNFTVTEEVSEANVIAGASNLSGAALEAAKAGVPYIGYSSGALGRNAGAASLAPGYTRTGLSGAMDCLAYVTYPNETLVNASYIADGDDVMYGYGYGFFSAIPEGAVALVQVDGSKTPTEGFIPTISERAAQTYEAFLNGGILGFSYDDGTVHTALFANTLTQKAHQRDEYAFISNFIFSSLMSDEDYHGMAEGDHQSIYLDDLKTAIADAEAFDTSRYPRPLVEAFEDALKNAKDILTFTDQDVIDSYFHALVDAMSDLWNFTFLDVAEPDAYYYDPVYWAFYHEPQITKGTSDFNFSPDAGCTRAQAVTFLWRAAGEPEPENKANPFEDVKETDYFYKAVLWAVEKGITTGTTATTFRPDQTCTRAQIVTFLWRNEGKPAFTIDGYDFEDVASDAYYYNAVQWAVEKGITTGTTATTFRPDNTCTRGQIVTFLYRALAGKG